MDGKQDKVTLCRSYVERQREEGRKLPVKLSRREIRRIRSLARTMRLRDVSKLTLHAFSTVTKYAKGIRPMKPFQRKYIQPPCRYCGSL